jgi:toxin ParE1/3/4
MKIVVSDRARSDLFNIFCYLAERDSAVAESVLHAIQDKFEHLSRFPFIGRERESLAPGLRSLLVETRLIFYVVETDRVAVVRVIDGRMDVEEQFKR